MAGTEYKVIEAKNLEMFRREVIQEGEQAMAMAGDFHGGGVPRVLLCGHGKEGCDLGRGLTRWAECNALGIARSGKAAVESCSPRIHCDMPREKAQAASSQG
jgi:hypothetical protein